MHVHRGLSTAAQRDLGELFRPGDLRGDDDEQGAGAVVDSAIECRRASAEAVRRSGRQIKLRPQPLLAAGGIPLRRGPRQTARDGERPLPQFPLRQGTARTANPRHAKKLSAETFLPSAVVQLSWNRRFRS